MNKFLFTCIALFICLTSFSQKKVIVEKKVEGIEMNSAKPFLGIMIEAHDFKKSSMQKVRGVKVKNVVTGEAAYNAGIEEGDVITSLNGIETPSPSLFKLAVKDLKPRENVNFEFYRGNKKQTAQAMVGVKESMFHFSPNQELIFPEGIQKIQNELKFLASDKPTLGVLIEEDEKGVKIKKVMDDSAASEANLKDGDIITAINGKKISSIEELQKSITDKKFNDKIEVSYLRNGKKGKTKATLQKNKSMQYRIIDLQNDLFEIEDDVEIELFEN